MLGRAAALHRRERQLGRLITSPLPGARHTSAGPPLRCSPVGSRKREHPQVSTLIKPDLGRRRRGGVGGSQQRSPSAPWGHVESFCGFHGHLCTTSRNSPVLFTPLLPPFSAFQDLGCARVLSLFTLQQSHSCWGQGLLGVRATIGRVLRCESVLGTLCCSGGRARHWPGRVPGSCAGHGVCRWA